MPRNARRQPRTRKIQIRRTIADAFAVMKAKPVVMVPPLLVFILSMSSSAVAVFNNVFATVAAVLLVTVVQIFLTVFGVKVAYAAMKGKTGLEKPAGEAWHLMPRALGYIALLLVIFSGVALADMAIAMAIGYATGSQAAFVAAMAAAMIVSLAYLEIRLSFTLYGIAIDGKKVVDSFRASWKTTKGMFVNLLMLQIALGAVSFLAYVPVYVSDMIVAAGGGAAFVLLSLAASLLAIVLIVPLNMLAMIIAYQKLKR